MSIRPLLILVVVCLAAVSCGSSSETPDAGPVTDTTVTDTTVTDTTDTEPADTEPADTETSCDGPAITEGEAVGKAREFATANAGEDIAFGFFNSGDVVADVNARDDFWEVTFVKESGAIEIYLTCSGELASIGTSGDAIP